MYLRGVGGMYVLLLFLKLLFCEETYFYEWLPLSYISLSPFGSFRVCSPVKLVAELLSGKEWSPFLCTEQSSVPDSPPYQIQPEDAVQPSKNLLINTSAELYPALDVFEGSPVAPEEETAYENVDLSHVNTNEQQEMNRGPCTATSQILVESDANQMSK